MLASKVFMCRPAAFGFNEETGLSNSFQQKIKIENANEKALQEFDAFVKLMRENLVEVIVGEDTPDPAKPDAVFPNNWFSTHPGGKLFLYPMLNTNRRLERRADVVDYFIRQLNYHSVRDYSVNEEQDKIVEGTGSMVFDHDAKKCFAAISPRTNADLCREICSELGYKAVLFHTKDKNGMAVYHTNVVMHVSGPVAAVCNDCVEEKELLAEELEFDERKIIELTYAEMENFAGNMLMLKNRNGENVLVMSDTAYTFLGEKKIREFENTARILHPAIPTIEKLGGGSVRCMMAELF